MPRHSFHWDDDSDERGEIAAMLAELSEPAAPPNIPPSHFPVVATSPPTPPANPSALTDHPSSADCHPSSPAQSAASFFVDPAMQAFSAIAACRPPGECAVNPSEVLTELQAVADRAASGDSTHSNAIASTQATALNVIFGRLTELAMHNVAGPYFDSMMRLALRAQSQCVRTIETLGHLHQPTPSQNSSGNTNASANIIAHQVNLANQQIVHHTST